MRLLPIVALFFNLYMVQSSFVLDLCLTLDSLSMLLFSPFVEKSRSKIFD